MKTLKALLLGTATLASAGLAAPHASRAATPGPYAHVLLISIDGMHAQDLSNWFRFAKTGNGGSPLKTLSKTATVFMNAFASAPSDSFPGLLAMATGGTPASTGVYYDDGYDRLMYPPGSACSGAVGTEANYSEVIDKSLADLTGGGTLGQPLTQIAVTKLPLQLVGTTCTPVLPHSFLRTNTIFEVAHAAGYRTAWSDKHPAYEILNGPSGSGVDDLYTPEINAADTLDPGANGTDYTQSFKAAQSYDHFKVQSVLNEIDGFDSTGANTVGVPAIFGMNFQSVSVGQKLAVSGPVDPPGLKGGYKNGVGTWNTALFNQIAYVDSEIGRMVAELTKQNLMNSTLIIITAKHGQSPINPKQRFAVDPARFNDPFNGLKIKPGDPYPVLAHGVYDDIGLIWLQPSTQSLGSYKVLQTSIDKFHALRLHLATLLTNIDLAAEFKSPFTDSRVPDFMILPFTGVVYTTGTKLAEHGGFADEDRNVALMISNPNLVPGLNASVVETRQIAPTILQALGLNYNQLQSVQQEPTTPLPLTQP